MVVKIRWIPFLLLTAFPFLVSATDSLIDPERVLWTQKPIVLNLQVDKERLVRFSSDVSIWLPSALVPNLRVESVGGVIYLKANQRFPEQRIRIQEKDSTRTYLLDVKAVKELTASHDLLVVTQEELEQEARQALQTSVNQGRISEDWYIRLTRHAVQQLYAPERLMPSDRQITAVMIDKKNAVPLFDSDRLMAVPVAAWRGGGYFVTAVRVRNLSSSPACLDLDRNIRGDWLALTLQHSVMQPAGSVTDRTTLYLVSKRPFGESL